MVKFVDTVKVFVESGNGGRGCSSMRHEKYVEFGGPNGGDGGRGGDVHIQGSSRMTSLQDLRLHPHQKAKNGMPGLGDQKNGKAGDNKLIEVPLGTIVCDEETSEIYCEVLEEKSYLLLKGGKGGLGNMHFKSSIKRAPRYAQPGLPGQSLTIRLELKIMADVGLVGFPNAGKSTFISAVSNARPKIADYPFTTLVPNLGVVALDNYQSFVIADIPGIIENAHQGMGLGDRFLKHIQRTSVLAFLIDCSGFEENSPVDVFKTLLNELELYSGDLLEKKRVVLLSKIDSIRPDLDLNTLFDDFKAINEEPYAISSVSRNGLKKVLFRLHDIVQEEP
ncbi:MAG: GTPase ObgE [Deltaproteobacteria bacterium]|jgi:GTPase|nr:GTPase ObgE [Deltaproteobacteria bacterium]MBT4527956.1 GTPase ObgE [Deltaproteobacteria bacterium]